MTTNKRVRGAVLSSSIAVGVLVLLMVGLFAGAAQARPLAQQDPGPSEPVSGKGITPTLWSGNPTCEELGYKYGFKINAWDTKNREGTFLFVEDESLSTELTGGAPADPSNSVTISNVVVSNGDKILFDWAATLGIDAVKVKGGDFANLYEYDPEEYSDTGLGAPINPANNKPFAISHVEFCYDYEDECADLNVFKYLDANEDGKYDEGEVGLQGWTIEITGTETSSTTLTNGDGFASFECLPPGTYTVCETLEPGWINSDPADDTLCKPVELVAGRPKTVKFGNYPDDENDMGAKMGRKFHDLNADGVEDGDELGLHGWEIHLFDNGQGSPAYTATTDWDGCFGTAVVSGCYTVCEVLKDGWTQSLPFDNFDVGEDGEVVSCDNYGPYGTWGYYECIDAGEVVTNNLFGNWQYATKEGTKFHDRNGNGIRDEGELGLEGWTIAFLKPDNGSYTEVFSTTTGDNGEYAWDEVMPGEDYLVCEVLKEGWEQSYPTQGLTNTADCPAGYGYGPYGYEINLESGSRDILNDFGNWEYATKSGFKFDDVNHSGFYEDGVDELLEGWTIHLLTVDGDQYTEEDSDVTGENGRYTFDQVVPGQDYLVCEVLQDGWVQVYPTAGMDDVVACPTHLGYGPYGYAINLESGEVDDGNNFGNDPKVVVGGVSLPSSGLALLAPWIVLGSLVGLSLVAASIVVWRRRETSR